MKEPKVKIRLTEDQKRERKREYARKRRTELLAATYLARLRDGKGAILHETYPASRAGPGLTAAASG